MIKSLNCKTRIKYGYTVLHICFAVLVHITNLNFSYTKITRIPKFLDPHKIFLDTSRADEPVKDANASSFVICTAGPSPSERLLAHHGARAFFVIVDITSCVTEFIGGSEEGCAGRREAGRFNTIISLGNLKKLIRNAHSASKAYSVVLSIISNVFS